MQSAEPCPRISDTVVSVAQYFAFLNSFQVVLVVLVWGPHFENP